MNNYAEELEITVSLISVPWRNICVAILAAPEPGFERCLLVGVRSECWYDVTGLLARNAPGTNPYLDREGFLLKDRSP